MVTWKAASMTKQEMLEFFVSFTNQWPTFFGHGRTSGFTVVVTGAVVVVGVGFGVVVVVGFVVVVVDDVVVVGVGVVGFSVVSGELVVVLSAAVENKFRKNHTFVTNDNYYYFGCKCSWIM